MVYLDYEPMDEYQDDFTEFCGDMMPHEPHDSEGTATGRIFIKTCPGLKNEEREVDNDCVE